MKKILSFLLCFIMVFSLVACSGNQETSKDTSANTESSTDVSNETSESGKTIYKANIPEDFSWEGDFIILSTATDPSTMKYTEFGFNSEELEENVLNDAVKTRNDIVEDLLGIKIVEEMVTSGNRNESGEFVTHVQTAINSGTGKFAICSPSLYQAGALAKNGQFYNLNDIENMALESEWWDKYFIDAVNVMNKLYFLTGDIGFIAKNSISTVFFNKDIAANLELENPYQLVKDNKWTIDKIHTWAKMYNEDVDNNGSLNHLDKFGIGGQYDNFKAFFFAAGERFATLDNNNMPTTTGYSERSAEVATRFQEFITDKSCFVCANDLFGVSSTPVNLLVDAFVEGRALMFWDALSNIEGMRMMDVDFGILPAPLYDESQERYHSMLVPWPCNAFAIAGNVDQSQLEDIATVMNVLGAEGKNYVTPAYVETTLKGQRLRDDDSEDMLDIIFANIGCDIGYVYCFASTAANILNNTAAGQNFTTLYDSYKSTLENNMNTIVDIFESLD